MIKDCGFDAARGTCLLTEKPISSAGQARPAKASRLIGGLLGLLAALPPPNEGSLRCCPGASPDHLRPQGAKAFNLGPDGGSSHRPGLADIFGPVL